jgi:ketosteroid isomerase-like protein
MTEQAQIEALQAHDVRGATRVYADSATRIAPSGNASGMAAITGQFEKLLADPAMKFDYHPGPSWASASGDLAVTTGTANLVATDGVTGRPSATAISYQTVWRKVDGIGWKIVSDYGVQIPGRS